MAEAEILRFYQPKGGYAYNSDSLLLVDFARQFLAPAPNNQRQSKKQSARPKRILDMGAGCGIIGLLCAHHFGVESTLVEINPLMANLARINATTNSAGNAGDLKSADDLENLAIADDLENLDSAFFGTKSEGAKRQNRASLAESKRIAESTKIAESTRITKSNHATKSALESARAEESSQIAESTTNTQPARALYSANALKSASTTKPAQNAESARAPESASKNPPASAPESTHQKPTANAHEADFSPPATSALADSASFADNPFADSAPLAAKPLAKVYEADFLSPDIASIVCDEGAKFDFLIANPPFYRDGALMSKTPALSQARHAATLPARAWIAQSKRVLAPRGGLIFCYRPSDMMGIFDALKSEGFNCEMMRVVYPLSAREASLVLFFARLDSRTPLKILPPLITHASPLQSDFTKEVAQIYATYRTHSIKV
ncbi:MULTISPECIES: methyltransferase [unclassified Helicobacter]|uniref:methyltransferase n=1 Tax=unclassified Helicobacter TaxID=2593540 RepID=UPI0009EF06D3|nr:MULTISPECIES: methyltransferase [unclassified Helicobacter]